MLLGLIYQALAAARDRQNYPPPGKLVDVGSHKLHVQITGQETGKPAIVLDAGMASFSSNFAWVQQELAALTRVVAYDRAGLGWSEPGPKPRDARRSAEELHTALEQVDLRPPYVLAGHSYGGLVSRAFIDLYPDEVAGLVLIDASHPDQWANIPASRGGRLVAFSNKMLAFLGTFGLLRLWNPELRLIEGLPPRQLAEMRAFLATPRQWSTGGDGLLAWDSLTRPQINAAKGLGDLPLFVLSVSEQDLYAEVLTRLQAELATLSSNSVHLTVQGATHDGLVCRQESAQVVADAIRQVVEAAYHGQPLALPSAGSLGGVAGK